MFLTLSILFAATFNVIDGGADPAGNHFVSEAVNKLITAAQPGDTIFFPKGVYALDRHFGIWGKKELTLLGEPGTILKMHCNPQGAENEASGAFVMGGSQSLKIKNFMLTTDNPVGTQGRIANCNPEAHEIVVRIDANYAVTGTEHFFQLDTTDEEGFPDHMIECHQPLMETTTADGRKVWQGMPYQMLDSGRVRIQLPKWFDLSKVKAGRKILIRYFRNGESPISIIGCENVTVEDFVIERTPSCGASVAPASKNIFFNRFVIAPPAGSDALIASNADGIHILGCAGRVGLKDCRFWGLGDDALNIHTMAGELREYDTATGAFRLILRGPDRSKECRMPANWGAAGNELEVYDAKTFLLKGKLKLASYDSATGTGEFEKGEYQPQLGDMCVNTRDMPAVRIVNCTVENTRARAFLLQTRDVRISGSTFRGLPGAAIIFSTDFAVWNEAGPPKNVEISDCLFEKCAASLDSAPLGAIVVKANHDAGFGGQPHGVFKDFRILNNRFVNIPRTGVYLSSTDDIRMDGNDWRGCRGQSFELRNCMNVLVDGKPVKSN